MAPRGGGSIKGFYRQKKGGATGPGVSKKPNPTTTTTTTTKKSATYGSNITQPPALISHGSLDLKDDFDAQEEVLRQFDLNMAYGPCAGMSRLARWERAEKLGMNPPKKIQSLLSEGNKVQLECLWEGRI